MLVNKRAKRAIRFRCSLTKEQKEQFAILKRAKERKSDSLFFVNKQAIRRKKQRANSQPSLDSADAFQGLFYDFFVAQAKDKSTDGFIMRIINVDSTVIAKTMKGMFVFCIYVRTMQIPLI